MRRETAWAVTRFGCLLLFWGVVLARFFPSWQLSVLQGVLVIGIGIGMGGLRKGR